MCCGLRMQFEPAATMLLLACAADNSGLSVGLQNLQSVLSCAVCD